MLTHHLTPAHASLLMLQVVLFCLAAFQASASAFAAVFTRTFPASWQRNCQAPILGELPLTGLVAALPAAGLVVLWVSFREASWSWVLQDVLGMALSALILRQFRLPNIKVGRAGLSCKCDHFCVSGLLAGVCVPHALQKCACA